MGFCPIFGIWQDAGIPATSQMRCWLLLRRHKLHIPRPAASGRSRPFRCASSQNRNRVAGLRFCVFCARRCNMGLCGTPAHTSQAGQKAALSGDTRLTVRCRRSAHPQGRSCRSFSRAENRHHRPFSGRSGVLRCSFETRLKCRFALEYQRFFGFDARSCSASSPRFRQGRSFPTTLLQGR